MNKVLLLTLVLMLGAPMAFAPTAGIATAGIIDPCGAPVVYTGVTPECYFACPHGDTDSFLTSGFFFSFTILDLLGHPIANIPGTDFWMIDCDPTNILVLCAGSASSRADSATNALGKTTMSLTSMAVGGCATGLSPVCQGIILQQPGPCTNYCFSVRVRSCDRNADLLMNLSDLAIFASDYPPNPYDECSDFDCDGIVNIVDLARFAIHYGPPGHKCL